MRDALAFDEESASSGMAVMFESGSSEEDLLAFADAESGSSEDAALAFSEVDDTPGLSPPAADEPDDTPGLSPPTSPSLPASLLELFHWPSKAVAILQRIVGKEALQTSLLMAPRHQSFTTHFSGVGAAELAWQSVDNVAKALGKQGSWHCIGACEAKRANQQLLARILPANCCLSADISDRSLCAQQA